MTKYSVTGIRTGSNVKSIPGCPRLAKLFKLFRVTHLETVDSRNTKSIDLCEWDYIHQMLRVVFKYNEFSIYLKMNIISLSDTSKKSH